MRWWTHTFFSSSSLSPSSSSCRSPRSQQRQQQQQQRRLTRVRKLRHLRGRDIAGVTRLSSSPESIAYSRSPSIGNSPSPPSSAGPQPLPLPELSSLLRRDGVSNSNSSDCPLPSPKKAPSRGAEDRDRVDALIGDGTREGAMSSNAIRRIAYQDARKSMDHFNTRSTRKVPRDLNGVGNMHDNFWLNVPVRSAPTSPYSSPALSPQRTRTRELFLSHSMAPPQGVQVWSAPEMPTLKVHVGFPSQASPERSMFSSDSSPLHSPVKSPQRNPRSPSRPASPLHKKLSLETSRSRPESNCQVNVHPLPLPPGATMPSQSAPIPQVATKVEFLPMTSQWQKGKLIGRGTFGSVYVATNRETGALCAMKEVELLPDDRKSAESIKQLEQEIKVLSQLKHPNIVQYYGSEIVGDRFYIYLEFVHPGSINKYIHEHCGAITESVVRNFTRHILSGLAYLHGKKTIHRDIKGANLLVDASGVVKLADFGMAKHLTGQAADLSLKGSPYWMAPELMQAVMQKDTSSDLALAVDIWSLGCTIIEMLNGKPPWSEYEGAAAMFKVMRESPPIPESLSSEGKDFLHCCFKRNPAERPSASLLLEHCWFLKSSQHLDVPSFTQAFHGMKLTDKANSPRERSNYNHDQLQIYPSAQSTKGKVASDSETSRQSHPETSDLKVVSHHSPRSTLDALPSLSPPRSGQSTRHPCPPANVYSNINRGAKKSHLFQ
ncbi:hypothetical protein L1049_024113 [Liquidambar formosana]|uniref:mitogen-activated protein kinase kinase kinase n=1 Tax=Liquidambar formosana TaxID=63359 RepID=A0AAP0WZA4_LIQFO